MLGVPLAALRMTEERLESVRFALRESHCDQVEFQTREVLRLNKEISRLDTKLNNLYEDKLEGLIDSEFWQAKHNDLTKRKSDIRQQLHNLDGAQAGYFETGEKIFEISQKAYPLYLSLDYDKQAEILKTVLSNCTLKGQQVYPEFRQPFDMIMDGVAADKEKATNSTREKVALTIWHPQRGSNPCCRRERAVS